MLFKIIQLHKLSKSVLTENKQSFQSPGASTCKQVDADGIQKMHGGLVVSMEEIF